MILVDLLRMFNTLDQKNLLEKMSCLGFKASVIKLFESYMTNNKFAVAADDYSLKLEFKILMLLWNHFGTTQVFNVR